MGGRKRRARLPRTPASLPPAKVDVEIESLQSRSGWRFSAFDKKFFRALTENAGAWASFEKLTKGRRPYPPAILLLSLGAVFSLRQWEKWEVWKDKWSGLSSVAETLKLVETKMKKHLRTSDRGPIPLPTMAGTERGDEDYHRSLMAESRLQHICKILATCAAEIEGYCEMRRKWLREVPRRDIAEKVRIGLFMGSVKGRTGKWYLEDVAKLLNVGRKISRGKEISAETLSKMLKLRTPLLNRWDPRTGYQWDPKTGKS